MHAIVQGVVRWFGGDVYVCILVPRDDQVLALTNFPYGCYDQFEDASLFLPSHSTGPT